MSKELKGFFENLVPLEPAVWADMEKIIQKKSLKRKEYFLREGDVCKRLGFIVKGYVRVFYTVNGEETTKDFNFENSFCGSYASFSLQQPSLFNSVAMEDTILYTLGREDLFRLFDKHPALQKVGRLSIEQMFIRKELREASFLLHTAQQRHDELISFFPDITSRVPLKHLASYLGIRPETLSRIRSV
jgi:CRP-like cAMP-binding protein